MKSGQFKYDLKEQQQINFEINTFININHFKINKQLRPFYGCLKAFPLSSATASPCPYTFWFTLFHTKNALKKNMSIYNFFKQYHNK